jgi:hypothetical protein
MAKKKAKLTRKKRAVKKAKKKAVKKPVKEMVETAKEKAPAKTEIEVTVRKKVLGKAPEEHSFVLSDGRKLQTIVELIDELETMAEQEFKQHVNEFKNDFANWIRDIFDEQLLAEELMQTKDKIETQRALLKHLVRELYKTILEK